MAAKLKVIDSDMALSPDKNADRQKALDAALAQIDRAFGKGSAMKLGSKATMQVEAISTGSLGLDIALGVGGLPRGRVIEIYGPESSGKTTLALHVIAEAQRSGGTAAFVDAEHALDPVYARKLGVDIDAQLASIHRVKRMFGVNKRGRPAAALCLGNDMESERRLAGAFRAINLDHTPARQPAHAKRNVEAQRASGNRLHLHRRL